MAINEVHTFNASMVNEFRAGYTRVQSLGAVTLDTTGVFGTTGNSVVGIPGPQAFAGFSAISEQTPPSPSGISNSGNDTSYATIGNANTGTNFVDNTFAYGDNFTWLKGKHTWKFGVTFLRQQQNNFYPGNDGSLGGFYYLGAATATPNADPNGYIHNGYNFADATINQASFASKGGVSGPAGMRSWRDAYFVQDDWKFLPNLTLNLGVRYDYVQPIYEVHNRMATVDPANPSVIITAGTPSTLGFPPGTTVVSAATAGYNRSLVNPYYGSVEPRIGFSYSVNPKWVWRGGYGIQNYMEGTGANLRMTTNLPYQSAFEGSGQAQTTTTGATLFQAQNGFGGGSTAAAAGGVFNIWQKNIKPAFIGEYSLTTEYQVSNTASFQIGYVGESGQHLITANSANQLQHPCIINGAFQTITTTSYNTACNTVSPAPYQLTPTIGYYGTIRQTASNAMMNYNALQATFRQRAWRGLQYTVNYTYSRAMTNSTGFYGVPSINAQSAYAINVYNNHEEYGPVGQDVRNNLNWNLVYDLPVGRGRQYGANMPFVLDMLVGGWRVAMTGVEYSGFPVNFSGGNSSSVNGAGTQRPNHLRKIKIVNRGLANWFGTDPSATPCAAGIGQRSLRISGCFNRNLRQLVRWSRTHSWLPAVRRIGSQGLHHLARAETWLWHRCVERLQPVGAEQSHKRHHIVDLRLDHQCSFGCETTAALAEVHVLNLNQRSPVSSRRPGFFLFKRKRRFGVYVIFWSSLLSRRRLSGSAFSRPTLQRPLRRLPVLLHSDQPMRVALRADVVCRSAVTTRPYAADLPESRTGLR